MKYYKIFSTILLAALVSSCQTDPSPETNNIKTIIQTRETSGPQNLITNTVYAERLPSESFEEALKRNVPHSDKWAVSGGNIEDPVNYKKPLEDVDFSSLVDWDYDEMYRAFALIRDARYIIDLQNLKRRIPWLYAIDGCWVRAHQAFLLLRANGYDIKKIKKLFIFGRLTYQDPHRDTTTYFWYHVALAVKSNDKTYILDPTLEAKRPLTLEEWDKKLGSSDDTNYLFSLANPKTYYPIGNLWGSSAMHKASELKQFTSAERDLLESLDIDLKAIKDSPPWRTFPSWEENDRKGNIGDVYDYDNPNSGQKEYFRLNNLGSDDKYWYFPINQKNNRFWLYLSNDKNEIDNNSVGTYETEITPLTLVEAEKKPIIHNWGENDRKGTIGDIYGYNSPFSWKKEFFKLVNLGSDGRYWYFPTNQTDNSYWEYLGTSLNQF